MIRYNAPLSVNKWSRPGKPLAELRAAVVHSTLAPGQDIRVTRKWWEDRKSGTNGYGGAHRLISSTETLYTILFSEEAYHVGTLTPTPFAEKFIGHDPNRFTVGIELCWEQENAEPTQAQWDELVLELADLCRENPDLIITTHFHITGMLSYWGDHPCHPWFAREPGELARLQCEVRERS